MSMTMMTGFLMTTQFDQPKMSTLCFRRFWRLSAVVVPRDRDVVSYAYTSIRVREVD
jgi:hypothetical protein